MKIKEFVLFFVSIFRTLSGEKAIRQTMDAVSIAKEACELFENIEFFARLAGAKKTKSIYHPSSGIIGIGSHFYCTCVLINSQYLLTSKHCLIYDQTSIPLETDLLIIRLGSEKLWDTKPFSDYRVEKTILHPSTDLGLIRLRTNVVLSSHVRPACLPVEKPTFQVDSNATIAGFGPIADQNGFGELRNLTVQYVKETQDVLEFRSKLKFSGICKGDSGSGLFIKEGEKQIVVAITASVVAAETFTGFETCGIGPDSRLKFSAIHPHLKWIVENAFHLETSFNAHSVN